MPTSRLPLLLGALAAAFALVQQGSMSAPQGAATAPRAQQPRTCGTLGTAASFDVFSNGVYAAANTQVQGRAAARGDVSVSSYGIGTSLAVDALRADLIAGGVLTASNAQAHTGSVTYGTALSGSISTPNGTLSQAPPPFSFDAEFAALRELSGELEGLAANGSITGPTYGAMQLTGTDPTRNVFAVTAALLQSAQQLQIKVPFGSTTIVNVSGTSYSSAIYPTSSISFWDGSQYVQFSDNAPTPELDALRRATLWHFPLANTVQIGPNMAWQGTVLAPNSNVAFPGSTQLNGQILGASVSGNGTVNHRPFGGCLPAEPVPEPTDDLELEPLCRNGVSGDTKLRLRNIGGTSVKVTWSDLDSAQAGAFVARANSDRYFAVADGDVPHRITVTSPTESVTATTETRACEGKIQVRKLVSGPGTASPGPWTIVIRGDQGYRRSFTLKDRQSKTATVPGDFQVGSVPIGQVPGGSNYAVSEPNPLGAVATVSRTPVTILDGNVEPVRVGNFYPPDPIDPIDPTTPPTTPPATTPPTTPPETTPPTSPPTTPPEPTPTTPPATTPPPTTAPPTTPGGGGAVPQPPQPEVPPGAPAVPDGPDFAVDPDGRNAPDLAVSQRVSPATIEVGKVALSRIVIKNQGVAPAEGTVLRELPQRDPIWPNSTVEIASTSGAPGGECTSTRPVRCTLGTIRAGGTVTVNVRAKVLVTGSLRSIVFASSLTPESNLTNNAGSDGLLAVVPTEPLRVVVSAPSFAATGVPVRYRVSVTATGKSVDEVYLCHRPSSLLLVTSAPSAHRASGKYCLDIPTLRSGQTRSFTVHAIAASRGAGKLVRLGATADSPGRPQPSTGFDMTRIVGVTASGLG